MRQPFKSEFVAWGSRSIFGVLFLVTAGQMMRTMSGYLSGWDAVVGVVLVIVGTPALMGLLFLAGGWLRHEMTNDKPQPALHHSPM